MMIRSLTAVAITIEKARQQESSVKLLQERMYKLEKTADSKWLLGDVVDDVLVKVNSITNAKKTKLWIINDDNFFLYLPSTSSNKSSSNSNNR